MHKILLISGHGAGDPGAMGTHDGATYKEADLTRELTALVQLAIQGVFDAEVTRYPVERNAYNDCMSDKLAVDLSGYDYVLEVHFNAFKAVPADGRTKGVEIYVPASRQANDVETGIAKAVERVGFVNRGVKMYPWAVIAAAQRKGVAASLLEVCFIDDPDDMAWYVRNTKAVAAAIATALANGLGLERLQPTPEEITVGNAVADIGLNSPEYWRAVLRGEKTASGANIKALMDKYHKALAAK